MAAKYKRKRVTTAREPKVIRVKRARSREREDDDDAYSRDGTVSSIQFWKASDQAECAGAVWTWIDRLRSKWVSDNLEDLIHEAIYEGRPLGTQGASLGLAHLRQRRSAPASLNITRSMVDTATARLTKRRPMPVISADDAGWSEKRFARKMSRVLRRKMGSTDVEKKCPHLIRDFIIRGTACAKVVRFGGDTRTERIPVYEVIVDPREAYYGEPRTMAHHRPVSRDVLLAEFPEYEKEILDAPAFLRNDPWSQVAYGDPSWADHVEVGEAWHLPSAPGATDGCHVITIRGRVLFREKWRRPRFPIAFAYWSAPTRGAFRGHGLVEDLTGIQAKVNDVVRDIQEALYYGSMLKVFQPRASNVNKHHLRARHPVVVEFDGAPPQFVAPSPVSPQSVQFLELLIQKAYEISGISQMTASSKNVLGSNASGKAIDTMDDIQSDRFAHVESGWMQARVEIGHLHIDEARAMYEEAHATEESHDYPECGDPITKEELAPWIRENDWSKVDIDAGDYHLTTEPINFIPDTRAGKLSAVAELSKAGLIPDQTMTADLFDEPDIARANRSILGPKHYLDKVMELLPDTDVPMMDILPDDFDNLELALIMAKGELKEAQANDASEAEVARYHEYIGAVKKLIEKGKAGAAQAMPPMPPGMPAAPGDPAAGLPMPPPGMPMAA